MALDPSNSSNLEQLALKGLILSSRSFVATTALLNTVCHATISDMMESLTRRIVRYSALYLPSGCWPRMQTGLWKAGFVKTEMRQPRDRSDRLDYTLQQWQWEECSI